MYFMVLLMNSSINKGILVILLALCHVSLAIAEQQSGTLESRIARLERTMNSQTQLELLSRVKQVKQENQQLRSLIEEQNNEIRILKQKQQQLSVDFNQRLGQLEGVVPGASDSSAKTIAPNQVEVIDKSVIVKPSAKVKQPEVIVEEKSIQSAGVRAMSNTDYQTERKSYQKAYNELLAKQYHMARNSFIKLIKQYPHGRYAHIAQYWIAEASYAQHNYEQAIMDYQQLIDHYAASPKKAEAELKKAYCYDKLANKDKARESINNLLQNYPDTTEAAQAENLLRKLQ